MEQQKPALEPQPQSVPSPSEPPRLAFLCAEIKRLIKDFGGQAEKHKLIDRRLKRWSIGMTVLAAVFAGAAITFAEYHLYLNFAIVITTAVIGGLATYEGYRKPRDLWIAERNAHNLLQDILRALQYEAAQSDVDVDTDTYFFKMQAVLEAAGDQWIQLIQLPPSDRNKVERKR